MGAVIEKIEYILPDIEVSNQDLQNEFPDYDFLKFEQKVGIKSIRCLIYFQALNVNIYQ